MSAATENTTVWSFKCTIPEDTLSFYLNALTEFGASVTWSKGRQGYAVALEATFSSAEESGITDHKMSLVLKDFLDSFSLELPDSSTIEQLEDRDWVAENRKSFPPLIIGQFFFHGSHYKGAHPSGKISIELDAAAAFGSGEHATTKGSLLALEKVLQSQQVSRMLDMGCGSGILSMVAGKLSDAMIVASDMDQASVRTTQENLKKNGVNNPASVRLGHGYETLKSSETFDLIVSNILAQPLIQMAPDLAAVLETGGHAILSGFLEEQLDNVVEAHEREGLTFVESALYDGWVTVVLKK